MKKSIYNHLCLIQNNWVLYNSLSDEIAILDSKVKELFTNSPLCEIERIHPDFFKFVSEKKFIVPNEIIESESCIAKWKEQDNDSEHFSLTVNPTLDCNMRCWYCYEEHTCQRKMNPEIFERTCKFIESKISSPELKYFSLTFFGGEPLIEFNRIVQPLIKKTLDLAIIHKKGLGLNFVTNGFLLSEEISSFLSSLGVPVSFQITLDGNEDFHNKTRHTVKGERSYNKILENCKRILKSPEFKITLRFNYTDQNADSFIDVLNDLIAIGIHPSESLHIDFQRVWQDAGNTESVEERIDFVRQSFSKHGFSVSSVKNIQKYRCYADTDNHVVINYDGNLYHCTARDFTGQNSEGFLSEDGVLHFNKKAILRSKIKWGNTICQKCHIYPICQGLCSQSKIENITYNGCLTGYSEEEKSELLDRRVKYLVKKSKMLMSSNSNL